ncbi:MAG: hypothetical protein BZ151_02405 [Desulfobacca sp. 4484_104]|nr:MAG: hypothetical protein BZ151_02405 [Desulfobacca sp. 4484_104]
MAMPPFLFALPFRHLRTHGGRTLLTILGIALGAAVYLSIALAEVSALAAFKDSVDAVAGKANLQLRVAGASLDEQLLVKVRQIPGVQAAAPVIETVAEMIQAGNEPLMLLGIDLFAESPFRDYEFNQHQDQDSERLVDFLIQPYSILITDRLAANLGLTVGDRLPVILGSQRQELLIQGIFRPASGVYALNGAYALIDLGQAQELLNRVGKLDYIDLLTAEPVDQVAHRLQAQMPPGVIVERPQNRSQQVDRMVAAYRLNLLVLSLIALFVGMFLIFNAVSLSVVRRRREIGLLRTLGTSRAQIMALFLSEGAISGVIGGLLGIVLGIWLAQATLKVVTQNLTALFILVKAESLRLSWTLIGQTLLLAVGVSLVAAFFPAWEASRTQPREVWHREELEEKLKKRAWPVFGLGLVILILAGFCAAQGPVAGKPIFGFLAAFLILIGFALLTPQCAVGLGRLLQPMMRGMLGPPGELGCRYLQSSLSRTAVSIGALLAALAMLVSAAIMIQSFRQTVDHWITQSISGDIFLGPNIFSTAAYDAYLPPEVLAEVQNRPELADVYLYRCVRSAYKGRPILVIGGSMAVLDRHGGMLFRSGRSLQIFARLQTEGNVIVSESFAELNHLNEGDNFLLPTPSGPQPVNIVGVFYDYRTDGHTVWMDIKFMHRYWRDSLVNAVRLYLKDPAQLEPVRRQLLQDYGSRYRLMALSHRELRAGIMEIFDQSFALTYALEAIAVVVAIFGIITTFLVLIMERERELALLKAIGASRGQVFRMILVESGLVGLISHLLGALAGTLLSLVLIYVINKQSFGWTIQFKWIPDIYIQSLALVLAVGLTAGAYPAWRALQANLAAVLKEE